jgi:hypothetical protein
MGNWSCRVWVGDVSNVKELAGGLSTRETRVALSQSGSQVPGPCTKPSEYQEHSISEEAYSVHGSSKR